ncbi:hypothetical protein [Streptomyces cavernicola]|uniref:Uncharacterized protein n=1 Tax=Streptomyces cavernicola TaxID=3043613 RepID=A0ABT6S9X0_9ACTN|nr:hypothetical protein [Streptomyces sp. B-S-A6]MDI3404967.1 hypothetical protein [Streptomyces sp. B-S-A6]
MALDATGGAGGADGAGGAGAGRRRVEHARVAADGQEEGESELGSGTGLTVATAAFLFLVLRLFAVSHYDWHTAFAVLHTIDLNDSVGIVLGTVMADSLAATVFLALLVPVAVLRLVVAYRKSSEPQQGVLERHLHHRHDLAGFVLLVIALVAVGVYVVSFHAWWLPPVVAAVCALYLGIGYGLRAGGRLRRAALWSTRHLGALIVLALLLGAATVRTPWVPLERIELRGGEVLRGYVMQAEPGFLKVLTARDREFLILSDGSVASREEVPGGH